MNDRVLAVEEASRFKHLSVSALHKITAAKAISFCRLGKRVFFQAKDFKNFIDSRRVEANMRTSKI